MAQRPLHKIKSLTADKYAFLVAKNLPGSQIMPPVHLGLLYVGKRISFPHVTYV